MLEAGAAAIGVSAFTEADVAAFVPQVAGAADGQALVASLVGYANLLSFGRGLYDAPARLSCVLGFG